VRERIRIGPRPPADQLGPHSWQYRLGGFALVAAVLLGVVGFSCSSALFREKTLAEKMIEEQQRQAAKPPAPPPAPPRQEPPQPPPPAPPPWAERDPGNWQYLADMAEFDVKEGPWKFAKDGTTGNPEDRSPIKVGGFASPKGLGMHPNQETYAAAKYRLDRKALRFKAAGGVNDSSVVLFGPLVFEVWGDGRRLWQSERLTGGGQFRECLIDVADVEVLELRAVAVQFHSGLHAVWLEPRVLMK
jgi:hypothetical protein